MLKKAEDAPVLEARLATDGQPSASPNDLHRYTLAAHVHWAAEGALLAVTHLLGAPKTPSPDSGKTFAELQQHLDATISFLQAASPAELEAGLARTIVIKNPRGSVSANGAQFLLAFAIPHFHYHLSTAYGILRNQGVPLTMGDLLGNWGTN